MSESITATEIRARERIAAVEKVPTTNHEDWSSTEYPPGKSAEVNDSTSETIDSGDFWADVVSRQSLNNARFVNVYPCVPRRTL